MRCSADTAVVLTLSLVAAAGWLWMLYRAIFAPSNDELEKLRRIGGSKRRK